MVDHLRGPGSFTAVTATSGLASQCVLLGRRLFAGAAFWSVAIVLWIGLTYTIFTGLLDRARRLRAYAAA